ncbi:hypothetical protein C8J46_1076 [Sphingomonas sp. PP-F2F-A104-K0414]|uniref:hypothetical protein n=1 Tax=Sphingomonas sp. PP-F2F-A104-K0414 TaxID=2135661 RepID=UPI0010515507|nr:hypothetical protein [Sphingomonas sp. PP-F2F-A104-K0414]TCP96976.1 hypothetical protein C8J46_1076 [Sphingomonas sp. PP-F2F-A104-K0414]
MSERAKFAASRKVRGEDHQPPILAVVRRRWLYVWAVIGSLGIAILFGTLLLPDRPKGSANRHSHDSYSNFQARTVACHLGQSNARITVASKATADACLKLLEQDRRAFQAEIDSDRQADAAEAANELAYSQTVIAAWAAAVGLLTLGAAGAAALFAQRAAFQTKQSVRVGLKTLAATKRSNSLFLEAQLQETRPWVILKIKKIQSLNVGALQVSNRNFSYLDEPHFVQGLFEFSIECRGGRPAYDVFWWSYLHSGLSTWADAKYSSKDIINNWVNTCKTREDPGKIMFPGQIDNGVSGMRFEISDNTYTENYYPTLTIVVCYKSGNGNFHQTSAVYGFRRTSGNGFNIREFVIDGTDILIEERFGGFAT